jgi:hypothetical protein
VKRVHSRFLGSPLNPALNLNLIALLHSDYEQDEDEAIKKENPKI